MRKGEGMAGAHLLGGPNGREWSIYAREGIDLKWNGEHIPQSNKSLALDKDGEKVWEICEERTKYPNVLWGEVWTTSQGNTGLAGQHGEPLWVQW